MEPLIFEERWKYITDKSVPNVVPYRYKISDTGKVYSESQQRLLIPQKEPGGYYAVGLYLNNKTKKKCLIHRLVAIEFIPNENYRNLQVNHFDGNKSNNNVWNLEWVTCKQNIHHAYRRGLVPDRSGDKSSKAQITNFQAEMIGYLLSFQKYTHKEIAEIVNCSTNIVHQISKGENWLDVYYKFNLEKIKNKKQDQLFTNDQIHLICKYFQDHKNINYITLQKLFEEALFYLFGITIDNNLYKYMLNIYNRKRHKDISDQYDF